MHLEKDQRMLNLEVRTINKWTNQPDIWVAGKCCQHVIKIFMLKQQPELVGVNPECLWNLRSIILPNEQFVS